MARFDRQVQTAKRLIAKNGQAVKWRIVRDGEPSDPLKPWKSSQQTTQDKNVSIVFLPASRENRELLRYLKESEVSASSLHGIMSAVDFTPSLKDVVIRDGVEIQIKTIDALAPNGDVIIYFVQFENGGTGAVNTALQGVTTSLETVVNQDLPGSSQ